MFSFVMFVLHCDVITKQSTYASHLRHVAYEYTFNMANMVKCANGRYVSM